MQPSTLDSPLTLYLRFTLIFVAWGFLFGNIKLRNWHQHPVLECLLTWMFGFKIWGVKTEQHLSDPEISRTLFALLDLINTCGPCSTMNVASLQHESYGRFKFLSCFFPQGPLLTNYGLPIYLDAKLSSSVFGNDSPKLQPSHIRNAPWSILWPSPPLSSPLVSYFPTAGKTLKVSPAPQCFSDLRSHVSHHPHVISGNAKVSGVLFC